MQVRNFMPWPYRAMIRIGRKFFITTAEGNMIVQDRLNMKVNLLATKTPCR